MCYGIHKIDLYLLLMKTLIAYPENKQQLAALKAVAKVLKVPFETHKGSTYDPEFVSEVLQGVDARQSGKKALRVDVDNLWK